MQDWTLLRRYVDQNSQEAFAALTARYINLVYSTCLREIGDRQIAEDVTQSVFLILARKASSLRAETSLAGWLFQTARFASKNALTRERRRRLAEERAGQKMRDDLRSNDHSLWDSVEPFLNDALTKLGANDRDAVLLRCFEEWSFAETGVALGISEEAARKRVGRALEKMRRFLATQGIVISCAALATMLTTRAIKGAPSGCAHAIAQVTSGILAGQINPMLVSPHVSQLLEGVLQAMKIAQIKVIASAAAVALICVATYATAHNSLAAGTSAEKTSAVAAQNPEDSLTPEQIIQRSEKAYAALQSYQGTSTTDLLDTSQGRKTEAHATADIVFARPGKIRVVGSIVTGIPYTYVSNGDSTIDVINGHTKKEENVGMGIVDATDISLDAARTIPTVLLHLDRGNLLTSLAAVPSQSLSAVTEERIGDALCYRFIYTYDGTHRALLFNRKAHTITPYGPSYPKTTTQTLWFDAKLFLLRQIDEDTTTHKGTTHNEENITITQINAAIPDSAFALPPATGDAAEIPH